MTSQEVKEKENYRILVVDDTVSIHNDFRKILAPQAEEQRQYLDEVNALLLEKKSGSATPRFLPPFEIDSAHQGHEAVTLVKRAVTEGRPYAVAFVDVLMPPGEDGISTIGRLWKEDPDLQVVICTAYAKYSWDDILGILGETDQLFILKKPFDNIEVAQLASSLTKRWNLNHKFMRQGAAASNKPLSTGPKRQGMEQSANAFKEAVESLAAINQKLKSHLAAGRKDEEEEP